MNVAKITTLLTEEQEALQELEPLTQDDFLKEDELTDEDILNLNRSKIIELISSTIMSNFIGEGRDVNIERFFDFQFKVFKAASKLLDSVSNTNANPN